MWQEGRESWSWSKHSSRNHSRNDRHAKQALFMNDSAKAPDNKTARYNCQAVNAERMLNTCGDTP